MKALVSTLRQQYPQFNFVAGERPSWSPARQQITYSTKDETSIWSTFHELGHALLGHTFYESDLHLLQKETAAWATAVQIARENFGVTINNDHIQDCLDTYRDWLHKRSTCPHCGDHGLQPSQSLYRCLNCQNTWKVSSTRFCRPYRLKSWQKA